MRASAPHDDFVKTVKSDDCDEVSVVNLVLSEEDLLSLSLLHLPAHSVLKELDVGSLHVSGNVRSNDGPSGVRGEGSHEELKGVED